MLPAGLLVETNLWHRSSVTINTHSLTAVPFWPDISESPGGPGSGGAGMNLGSLSIIVCLAQEPDLTVNPAIQACVCSRHLWAAVEMLTTPVTTASTY